MNGMGKRRARTSRRKKKQARKSRRATQREGRQSGSELAPPPKCGALSACPSRHLVEESFCLLPRRRAVEVRLEVDHADLAESLFDLGLLPVLLEHVVGDARHVLVCALGQFLQPGEIKRQQKQTDRRIGSVSQPRSTAAAILICRGSSRQR